MPRLLKKIEANIISLFGGETSSDFTAPVHLLQSIVGEAGIEDYIELETFVGFTQNFSSVGGGEFCETTPIKYGLNKCSTYIEVTLDKK